MNRIAAVVAGLSLAFVGTSATIAATINVPGDYPTIQGAIDASVSGDVINIAAGTYYENMLEPGGKAITIQGTRNADGELTTTIDAQQQFAVFRIFSDEGSGAVIRDLIITGASGNWAGIYLFESSPIISGCTITGNTGKYGGIYCRANSQATISGCTISGNTADYGGGISCFQSNPTISGCTITGNTATYGGGGIDCFVVSRPTISGCTITGNTASDDCGTCGGGGILSDGGSNPTISGSVICGNAPDQLNGIGLTEGCLVSDSCDIGSNPGDVNGDGDVDVNDLDSLHASLGICPHDIDHDGDTDVDDLLRFLESYGTTCP